MPNKYQLVFLATFVSVFSALVLISRFLNSKLIEAGYDYRNLILLGLPDHEMSFDWAKIQDVLKGVNVHAVDVPYVGTYDLVAISKSPTFIITSTIILATAFLAKVLHSGLLPLFSSFFEFHLTTDTLGRTKPLDPNVWKEFPLEKKIKVSPNTAMCVPFLSFYSISFHIFL